MPTSPFERPHINLDQGFGRAMEEVPMPMYDRNDYEKNVLPGYLKKDIRELIHVAVALGWKLHITTGESCTIISHDERKKYHFGKAGRATNSVPRIRRDVFKFARPDLLLIADQLIDGKMPPEMAAFLPHAGDKDTIVDDTPESEKKNVPTPAVMPQKKEPVHNVNENPEPTIIRQQPMMAKASEGKAYESRSIIERHWSDRTVDYKCADCDYSNTDRLSVRSHRQKHGKIKGGARGTQFAADVPNAATYRPRQSRIDALADVLASLLEGDATPQGVAREALMWVHEQSRNRTPLAAEAEEMTPEETLNRIRTLLDDGTMIRYQQQMTELEQQMADLRARLEEAEAQAHAAYEARDKARSNLKAFTELAADLAQDGVIDENTAEHMEKASEG